jgi:hypothetical protein
LIDFLSGVVAMGYAMVGLFFLRLWGKSAARLYLAFAIAFDLLAINQAITTWIHDDERVAYAYALRVIAFTLILIALVDTNRSRAPREVR